MTSKFTGKVLALDIASTMGWAFGMPGTIPTFGSKMFGKPDSSRARRYHEFRLWLDLFASGHKVSLIVYESPAVPMIMHGRSNIDTVKLLIGFAEHLEQWAYERIDLREASVQQVRAHFIGGNYKSAIAKPLTTERCVALGWQVKNDDEADACALWDYQCSFLRPDLAVRTTPLFSQRLG